MTGNVPTKSTSKHYGRFNKENAAASLNARAGRLAGGLVGLFGGIGLVEMLKRSTELARASEESQARLQIAVGGNIAQFKSLQSTIQAVSQSSVYSIEELTSATEQMLERGVGADQIPKALQTIANTASALRLPIDEVGKQIAITFGGTVPRELGRAVPALRQLSEEALKSGAALDVLSTAYDGRAAAFAATDPGKEIASLRDINEAWVNIGKAILPIEREMLPAIAQGLTQLSEIPFFIHLGIKFPSKTELADNLLKVVENATGVYLDVEDNPISDSDVKSATDTYAKQQRASLDAESKDAVGREQQLLKERQDIELHGLQDVNRKREAETARSADEEFKARMISLQKYLTELDKAGAAERDRIASLATTTREQLGSTTGDLQANRNRLNGLTLTGDPVKDSAITEARERIQIQITADLQKQVQLQQQLLELSQQTTDSDRQRVDIQAKGIEEAIKTLGTSGTTGAKSVFEGHLTPGQLNDQIRQQTADIEAALPETFALADKIFSPADAAALKQRIATSLADAKEMSQRAADSVTPLVADLDAVGNAARKSAEDGIVKTLTEIETGSKKASDALGDLAKAFIETMLNTVNQRLVGAAIDGLFGTSDGKGGGTAGPSGLGGGLIGTLVGGLGGALKAVFNSSSGVQGSVADPNAPGGNGSNFILKLAQEALGPLGGVLGGLFGAIGSDNTIQTSGGDGDGSGNVFDVSGSSNGTAGAFPTEAIGGDDLQGGSFELGGYTGTGHPSEVAGIVHRGEFVVPADAVDRIGVSALQRMSVRTYSEKSFGGPIGSAAASGSNRDLINAVNNLAAIHSRPIPVAFPVDEGTIQKLHNHPTSMRILAAAMTRSPEYMKPAVAALKR